MRSAIGCAQAARRSAKTAREPVRKTARLARARDLSTGLGPVNATAFPFKALSAAGGAPAAGRGLRMGFRINSVLTLALIAAGLAACSPSTDSGKPQPGDMAVARVDGKPVWKSDVAREAVAQGLVGEGETLDVKSELFQRVLDEVVDQKLLAAEAIRRGLDK